MGKDANNLKESESKQPHEDARGWFSSQPLTRRMQPLQDGQQLLHH